MINFCFSLSATPNMLIQQRCWIFLNDTFAQHFPQRSNTFSPNILMSSTQTDKNSCDSRREHIPTQVRFHRFCFERHLPIFFNTAVLPKDYRVGLRLRSSCSVFEWVEVVSTLVDILSSVISAIWKLPTYVLSCMLIPRRQLLLLHWEVWKLFPEIWMPPFETVMRFAL